MDDYRNECIPCDHKRFWHVVMAYVGYGLAKLTQEASVAINTW